MIRFLACATALMPALTVGCSQSLFDSDPGAEQNARDGGSTPDSRVVRVDGGGGVDGQNMDVVDAGVQAQPLAVEYVETYDGAEAIDDVVMEMGTWNGLDAWVAKIPGGEDVRSAVVNCPVSLDSSYCAGLPENALLFVSTNDTHRPALRTTTSGTKIVVDYVWVVRESALTTEAALRIEHNGVTRHSATLDILNESKALLVDFVVVPRDVIRVVATPGAAEGGYIGMRVQIFEQGAP
jgi:hypothetical protein